MPTAAEKAKEKADRLAANRQARVAGEEAAAAAPERRAERAKPVRTTVDLAPAMYHDLEEWARDAARAAGRTRITRVDVMRELVRQLLADEDLAARVRSQLVTGS